MTTFIDMIDGKIALFNTPNAELVTQDRLNSLSMVNIAALLKRGVYVDTHRFLEILFMFANYDVIEADTRAIQLLYNIPMRYRYSFAEIVKIEFYFGANLLVHSIAIKKPTEEIVTANETVLTIKKPFLMRNTNGDGLWTIIFGNKFYHGTLAEIGLKLMIDKQCIKSNCYFVLKWKEGYREKTHHYFLDKIVADWQKQVASNLPNETRTIDAKSPLTANPSAATSTNMAKKEINNELKYGQLSITVTEDSCAPVTIDATMDAKAGKTSKRDRSDKSSKPKSDSQFQSKLRSRSRSPEKQIKRIKTRSRSVSPTKRIENI